MDWASVFFLFPAFLYINLAFLSTSKLRFISDFMLLLLPLVLIIQRIIIKKIKTSSFNKNYLILVSLLFIGLSLSLFKSVSLLQSLPEALKLIVVFLIPALVIIPDDKRLFRYFLYALFLSSVIVSTVFILRPYLFPDLVVDDSFFGLTGGHNQIAGLLVIVIPLTVGLYLTVNTVKKRLLLLFGLGILIIALLTSLSRGALLLISSFPIILFCYKKSSHHLWKRMIIIIPFVLMLIVIFGAYRQESLVKLYPNSARSLTNLALQPLNFQSRLQYFSDAITVLRSHLWFGQGLATYTYYPDSVSSPFVASFYVHNFLLQILAEAGIVNFMIIVLILFFLVSSATKVIKKHHDSFYLCILISIIFSLLFSLFDINLNQSVLLLITLTLAVFIAGRDYRPVPAFGYSLIFTLIVIGLSLLYLAWPILFKAYPISPLDFQSQLNKRDLEFDNRWENLDKGNGDKDIILARYYFDIEKYSKSILYLTGALQAPFNRRLDLYLLKKLSDLDFSQLSIGDLRALFNYLNRINHYFDNTFTQSGSREDQDVFFKLAKKIYLDPRINSSSIDFEKLSYWVIEGKIYGDTHDWLSIYQAADKLVLVGKQNYIPVRDAAWLLQSKDVSPDTLTLEATRLDLHSTDLAFDHLYRPLIGYLYGKASDIYYSKKDISRGRQLIEKAIQYNPTSGYLRIRLIGRLRQLGLKDEAEKELLLCEKDISPECSQWLLEFHKL